MDYYIKINGSPTKRVQKILGLFISVFGICIMLYIFFPLISWQIYFAPLTTSDIKTPIPKTTIVSSSSLKSLVFEASGALSGINYSNAKNWFPTYKQTQNKEKNKSRILSYTMSIPKLNIKNAVVSTKDYDLDKHLINYLGTGIPPENGNAVVFGHSTLPQLFDPNNYKTIFANVYKLTLGDDIFVSINNVSYKYKIFSVSVIDPQDTESVFAQNLDDSYLTIVTCTPPGTIWKRLILKSKLIPLKA